MDEEALQFEWERRADILQEKFEKGVITFRQFNEALDELEVKQ
jgi:uncharacterized membrane protein